MSGYVEKIEDITSIVKTGELYHFENFTYFGSEVIEVLDSYDSKIYSEDSANLTSLELHENMSLLDKEYHRFVVASYDDEIIGILVSDWIKDLRYPFWSFRIGFIDVHNDYKELGVGTNIISALDKADFLDSKIVRIGNFSIEGELYILPVINKSLKAKNYALLFSNSGLKVPPNEVGVYDIYGNLK